MLDSLVRVSRRVSEGPSRQPGSRPQGTEGVCVGVPAGEP